MKRSDLARTVVLGNGGSGKSWLAEQLAKMVGADTTDLDSIHWLPGGFNARRDPQLAIAMVKKSPTAIVGSSKACMDGSPK